MSFRFPAGKAEMPSSERTGRNGGGQEKNFFFSEKKNGRLPVWVAWHIGRMLSSGVIYVRMRDRFFCVFPRIRDEWIMAIGLIIIGDEIMSGKRTVIAV